MLWKDGLLARTLAQIDSSLSARYLDACLQFIQQHPRRISTALFVFLSLRR